MPGQTSGPMRPQAEGRLRHDQGGKTVLTRGDIVTEERIGPAIRDGGSSIWAENIKTSSARTNSASSIHMNGNMYADDLELAGRGSVTLQGNVTAIISRKNYGAQDPDSAKRRSLAVP